MLKEVREVRKKCKEDLFFLAKYILGYDFLIKRFHKPVCDFIQDMSVHRKLLWMSRGFLKTTIASKALPIWLTINNPNIRILLMNMIYDNAAKNIYEIRMKWQNCDALKKAFPECVPRNFNKQRWSNSCAEIRRTQDYAEGTYEAVGIGGSKIGSHYDVIIPDDPVAARVDDLSGQEILPNEEDFQKAIGWHGLAINLLVNPKEGYITGAGTKWGQYDWIRHIIDKCPNYKVYHVDAVKMDDKSEIVYGEDRREIPTYPERFPLEVLDEIKREQGDFVYSMMYLGKPYNVEDMVFKEEWLKEFEGEVESPNTYAALDCAGVKSRRADYTALPIIKTDNKRNVYLDYYIRAKMNSTEILNTIYKIKDTPQYDFRWLAMEKFAYELMLKPFIEERNKDRVNQGKSPVIIKQVKRPKGEDKDTHIRLLQPLMMAGRFYVRPWMREFKQEVREFPGGKKDLLDSVADVIKLINYPETAVVSTNPDPFSVEAVLKELCGEGEKNVPDWVRRRRR